LEQELFPAPHDYKAISSKLNEVFLRYSIQKQIRTISSDNASNMVKGIKVLINNYKNKYSIEIIHVRCASHILHLICCDFMKIDFVSHFENI
jgi:hypothetical protein